MSSLTRNLVSQNQAADLTLLRFPQSFPPNAIECLPDQCNRHTSLSQILRIFLPLASKWRSDLRHKDFSIVMKSQNLKQTVNSPWEETSVQRREVFQTSKRRTGIARAASQALRKVWSTRDILTTTKLQMYETLVLSCLLYNSEAWTTKHSSEQQLTVFEMACLGGF